MQPARRRPGTLRMLLQSLNTLGAGPPSLSEAAESPDGHMVTKHGSNDVLNGGGIFSWPLGQWSRSFTLAAWPPGCHFWLR